MKHKKSIFNSRLSPLILLVLIFTIQSVGANSIAAQTQTQNVKSDAPTVNDPIVAEILAKHKKAVNADSKPAKTVETITETEMNGEVTKNYHLQDLANNRFYQLRETPGEKTEVAYDGKRMWRKTPFTRGYFSESDGFFKASTIKGLSASEKKYKLLPNEKIDGVDYIVLQTSDLDPTGQITEMKYYYDPATYLLKRHVMGNPARQTVTYQDYRNVSGRMIAFYKTLVTSRTTLKTKTISVKYDVPFDEKKLIFEDDAKQLDSKITTAAATHAKPETKPSEQIVKTNFETEASKAGFLPEDVRLETFDLVWKTINDSYWDKNFGGINWQGVREKYLPLVKATEQSEPFHGLLNKMLAELGRSHLKIFSPANTVASSGSKKELRYDTLGIDARWLDSQFVVTVVKENSAADKAEIRRGYVITKINNRTLADIFEEYGRKNSGFKLGDAIQHMKAYSPHFLGVAGEKITLELLDDKNQTVARELVFAEGKPGNDLEFEQKRLGKDIGYIKFTIFFGEVLTKFQTALTDLRDTKGLIIDLRGNPGGYGNLAPAVINLLSEKGGSLGTLTYRYQKNQMTFKGTGDQAYRQPIVVLVDELSGSTAEIFAVGLQEQKRAFILGTPTAGAVLPSLFQPLPTRGGMQYVTANFETPKGVVLEGKGVTPDAIIKINRAELLAGRDAVLEAAIKRLEKSEAE